MPSANLESVHVSALGHHEILDALEAHRFVKVEIG
jgi:hypothetical protein